ncbi:hypothetical protein HY468_02935 [Candidatus Roizmanbacteria bacterium]|nr:hypothetical protein [Candidatus Roizmanbacteria bacterium]
MVYRKQSSIDIKLFHKRLIRHAAHAKRRFHTRHPHAVAHLTKKGISIGKLREHATKLLASGVVAGGLMLASPAMQKLPAPDITHISELPLKERQELFSHELQSVLPENPSQLYAGEEERIAGLIQKYWNIKATSVLHGNRLNHAYGFIGAEQHLPRYPGDRAALHNEFIEAGITPGRGAWGYFAPSQKAITSDLIQKEKYYVAVQTLYIPEWNRRFKELRDWYKYRKVLVINPVNGKVMVACIADAGPANWTGKQFGASPEVMGYLNLQDGRQRGKVFILFIDDPEDKIPLGPIGYNQ